jgi:hypothetical protein
MFIHKVDVFFVSFALGALVVGGSSAAAAKEAVSPQLVSASVPLGGDLSQKYGLVKLAKHAKRAKGQSAVFQLTDNGSGGFSGGLGTTAEVTQKDALLGGLGLAGVGLGVANAVNGSSPASP